MSPELLERLLVFAGAVLGAVGSTVPVLVWVVRRLSRGYVGLAERVEALELASDMRDDGEDRSPTLLSVAHERRRRGLRGLA